jgi:cullin-associated NEDD8-dissociated protein 1
MYSNALPTVVSRIAKEREENVKLDLMSTVVAALEQTAIVSAAEGDSRSSSGSQKKLAGLVADIVKGLQKDLVGKSPKTKIGAFQLLRELVKVIPDSLDSSIEALIPGLQQGLDEKASSPLKIEALAFLRAFMAHKGAAAVFIPHIQTISTLVLKAISDPYYKINAEALRVLTEIVKILASGEAGFNPEALIPPVFEATLSKLRQLDIDQEVKEGAIECTGLHISLLGDKLNEGQINQCLTILVERLSNEVTRLGTVKTIEQIASSKLKIDLSGVLPAIVKDLSGFLRKKSRPLKQASLSSLVAIVKNHGKSKAAGSSLFEGILKESAPLVSEQDLHLAHLSLLLSSSIVHVSSSSAENVAKLVLPNVHTLLKSSLLQGVALQSLLRLFKELVTSKSKKVTYDSLLSGLTGIVNPELSRQSFSSIAQCIAVLVANSDSSKDTIQKFVTEAKSSKTEHQKLLAIFAIGEIGSRVDLSGYADLKKNLVASFDAPSEETKSAASTAFGCLAVGNMNKFLPEILSEIESSPKKKYLLLGSLREVIVRLSDTKEGKENLSAHFDSLLSLLFQNTAQEEEGTRNVVSECLGKLALINPETVVTQLRERTTDSNLYTRACITTAVKFTIFEKSLPVDKVLKEHIGAFLDLLSDPEIPVRKAVMLSLNYVAHHKPKIIRDVLGKYLPNLYGESKIKKELIKEVDLGPFKHKVDAGIELRQASFECVYTLLDTCLTRLDLQELISHLVSGLSDEYDIQMLNHLILIRLAKIAGSALSGGLEQLVDPLKACVTAQAKEAAVAQQVPFLH